MNRNWQQELSDYADDTNSVWSVFKLILNEGISKYIPQTTDIIGNGSIVGNVPFQIISRH